MSNIRYIHTKKRVSFITKSGKHFGPWRNSLYDVVDYLVSQMLIKNVDEIYYEI